MGLHSDASQQSLVLPFVQFLLTGARCKRECPRAQSGGAVIERPPPAAMSTPPRAARVAGFTNPGCRDQKNRRIRWSDVRERAATTPRPTSQPTTAPSSRSANSTLRIRSPPWPGQSAKSMWCCATAGLARKSASLAPAHCSRTTTSLPTITACLPRASSSPSRRRSCSTTWRSTASAQNATPSLSSPPNGTPRSTMRSSRRKASPTLPIERSNSNSPLGCPASR